MQEISATLPHETSHCYNVMYRHGTTKLGNALLQQLSINLWYALAGLVPAESKQGNSKRDLSKEKPSGETPHLPTGIC